MVPLSPFLPLRLHLIAIKSDLALAGNNFLLTEFKKEVTASSSDMRSDIYTHAHASDINGDILDPKSISQPSQRDSICDVTLNLRTFWFTTGDFFSFWFSGVLTCAQVIARNSEIYMHTDAGDSCGDMFFMK